MPPNDLAVQQSPQTSIPPDKKPYDLPRVALRFLPRQPKNFEALFGIPDLPLARQYLRELLFHRGIREEVLNALDLAPRHVFVPSRAAIAYVDIAIQAEHTFVQAPSVVAAVCSTLSSPDVQVLELGTGTGYQSAVLAAFGAQVTSIDSQEAKSQAARERLEKLDFGVQTLIRKDDPLEGLEPSSFDMIVVNEGLLRMPRRLLPLVREIGGNIVAPIRLSDGTHRLMRYRRSGDQMSAVDLGPCFAPQVALRSRVVAP